MQRRFKTNILKYIVFILPLYCLVAYATFKEQGYTSIPFLLFMAFIWNAILSSGWNDVYLYKDKIVVKNYLKFWRKNSTCFFNDIMSFDIVEIGGKFYYELRIYLNNKKVKRFSISNQIDSYDLFDALESCGLKNKIIH